MTVGVLAFYVWSEVQICIWPSWCHCLLLSLAPGNPDWFWFYLSDLHMVQLMPLLPSHLLLQ